MEDAFETEEQKALKEKLEAIKENETRRIKVEEEMKKMSHGERMKWQA
jgi:hypothetical protein